MDILSSSYDAYVSVCQREHRGLKRKATAAGGRAKEKEKERRAAAPKTKANKMRPPTTTISTFPSIFHPKQASLPLRVSNPAASSDLSRSPPYPLTIPDTEKGAWIQGT
jgi:hypothetical protein